MFELVWRPVAQMRYDGLGKATGAKARGLFKQGVKALKFLRENPRHPSLQTHPYMSLTNPYDKREKVFETYVQQNTPATYRVFWCYGPKQGQMTIIAMTAHP